MTLSSCILITIPVCISAILMQTYTLTAENTNGYLISLFYCHSCFPPYHMHNTSTTKTAAFHSNHMKTIKGNWNITKRELFINSFRTAMHGKSSSKTTPMKPYG